MCDKVTNKLRKVCIIGLTTQVSMFEQLTETWKLLINYKSATKQTHLFAEGPNTGSKAKKP